ncbi:hypothetical protein WA588_005739 [Blastocystis sp. NMH]
MTPGRKEGYHVPVENSSDHTAKSEVPIVNSQSTNQYAKWLEDAAKRRSTKPFEERRIGWITSLPKEQVVCCGQSARDLCRLLPLHSRCRVDHGRDGSLLHRERPLLLALLDHHQHSLHRIRVSFVLPLNRSIAYGVIGLLFLLLLFTAVALKSRSIDHERLLQLAEDLDCVLC